MSSSKAVINLDTWSMIFVNNSVKTDSIIANSKVNNIKQLISFCNTNWSKLLNVHLCQENKSFFSLINPLIVNLQKQQPRHQRMFS